MQIRPSTYGELDRLMEIFDEARYTISLLGIDQWQDGYPSRKVIEEDIAKKQSFCIAMDGKVCGTLVMIPDGEVTYQKIYEGTWLTDTEACDYLTIHRVAIAVECRGRGIAKTMMEDATDYARRLGKRSLRIDTHKGNVVMRRMLEKNGFSYCGVIYLESGAPRVAYEKLI